jgi:hypothetical protein
MPRLTSSPQIASTVLLRRLIAEFERNGWRDDGETALAIVQEVKRQGRCPSQKALGKIVPSAFLAQNAATRRSLQDACRAVISQH